MADTVIVAGVATNAEMNFTQEILRDVAESVRGAFPRASDSCELVLIDVDPRHVHAFWNVPPATAATLRAAVGSADDSAPLVLRMTEVLPDGEDGDAFDIEVVGLQGQYYVDVWSDARRYRAEIGFRPRDGGFAPLAQSNIITLPLAAPSVDTTWREIALRPPPVPTHPATPWAEGSRTAAAAPPIPNRAADLPTAAASLSALPNEAEPPVAGPTPSPAPLPGGSLAPPAAADLGGPVPQPPAEQAPQSTATASSIPEPTVATLPGPVGISAADAFHVAGGSAETAPPIGVASFPGEAPPPPRQGLAVLPTASSPGEAPPHAPPTEERVAIDAALSAHEREAIAPLAPFPYYEPEAEAEAAATEPAAASEGEPAATAGAGEGEAETVASAPESGEGPEPVPLPIENVLTLSSFALAGGAVEFEINAELHIFGRAKPGLKLQLFGRPVSIRPDGTFTINRPLPNGALVLSVLLAKNGEKEE